MLIAHKWVVLIASVWIIQTKHPLAEGWLCTFFKVITFKQFDQRFCSQIIFILNVASEWSLIYMPLVYKCSFFTTILAMYINHLCFCYHPNVVLIWRFLLIGDVEHFPYSCLFILLSRNVCLDPLPIFKSDYFHSFQCLDYVYFRD